MCDSLSITTPVSLLAIEFDVRSVLHGQVSMAAVNQIFVIHEAMNGYKNLQIHKGLLRKCNRYLNMNTPSQKSKRSWHLEPNRLISHIFDIDR